jgi:hypothetical protein
VITGDGCDGKDRERAMEQLNKGEINAWIWIVTQEFLLIRYVSSSPDNCLVKHVHN